MVGIVLLLTLVTIKNNEKKSTTTTVVGVKIGSDQTYNFLKKIIQTKIIPYTATEKKKFRDWIINQFQGWGYKTTNSLVTSNSSLESNSVIKPEINNLEFTLPGSTKKTLAIGAHYDLVEEFIRPDLIPEPENNFNDNRSGVALVLALAYFFSQQPLSLPYTLKFLFWDQEESGLIGSKYYAVKNKEKIKKNWQLYINLDSVAGGDELYYGFGNQNSVKMKDNFKKLAVMQTIFPFKPNYVYTPEKKEQLTPFASDYASFSAFLPVLDLVSTNFNLGEKDGYTQVIHPEFKNTEGKLWHTKNDNIKKVERIFPNRINNQLKSCFQLLTSYLNQFSSEDE